MANKKTKPAARKRAPARRTGRAPEVSRYQATATDSLRQMIGNGMAKVKRQASDGSGLMSVKQDSVGDIPVPHIITFTGYTGQLGKVYRNPDEAWRDSRENARYMRNDLSVMECVEARQRAVALLPWHITTDHPDDPIEKEMSATLTCILNRIPRFVEMRRNLQEAIWYGRSGMQFNFGRERYYDRTFIMPVKDGSNEAWSPINGDKLAFRYDDGRVGIRIGYTLPSDNKQFADRISIIEHDDAQNPSYAWDGNRVRKIEITSEYGRVYFLDEDEMDRVLIHKHMIEDADFETPLAAGSLHGVGIRSRIYWSWFQKQNTLALLMEYLERSAMGFEIWKYPHGNAEYLAAIETAAFERLGAGKNIVFMPIMPGNPELAEMEHVETGLAGMDLVDSLAHRYYEWAIKRYILGQVLSTEPESGGLSAASLGDFQKTSLFNILKYDAINGGETMSHFVNHTIKVKNRHVLPIGSENIPARFVYDTESPEMDKELESIEKAFEMGLPIKKDDIYGKLKASKPTENDDVIQKAPPVVPGAIPGALPGLGQAREESASA